MSVHLLGVRDGSRENVPHPGDAAHKGALVLVGMGIRHLYSVTASKYCSCAPCGDLWRLT